MGPAGASVEVAAGAGADAGGVAGAAGGSALPPSSPDELFWQPTATTASASPRTARKHGFPTALPMVQRIARIGRRAGEDPSRAEVA